MGIRSVGQQTQQSLHRVRSQAVGNRTAHVNMLRGLVAEFGLEIAQGRSNVGPAIAAILNLPKRKSSCAQRGGSYYGVWNK